LIQNPYFYVRKGHQLKDKSCDRAIKAYDRAIALDDHCLNAHYHKALAHLSYKDNKGEQKVAQAALERAKQLISVHYKPSLLNLNTLAGYTGPKPRLAEHIQHQIDILSQQEKHIEAALRVLHKARDKGWQVKVTENKDLVKIFKKSDEEEKEQAREEARRQGKTSTYKTPRRHAALMEAEVNGLTKLFTIKEVEPTPWWSIIAVALIGIAQIAAGTLTVLYTAGACGWGLIQEGISDITTAIRSAIDGTFSWAQWAIQKAISLAVSLCCAGIDALKILGSGAAKAAGKAAGETVGKLSAKELLKRVALEVGKGVAKDFGSQLVEYGLNQFVVNDVEKYIAEKVSARVLQSLEQSTFVQNALSLDCQTGGNYWQQKLIQEGLAILRGDQDSTGMHMLKSVAKSVLTQEFIKLFPKKGQGGVSAFLQGLQMQQALKKLFTFTDEFLSAYKSNLARKYSAELREHQAKLKEAQGQQATRQADEQEVHTQQMHNPGQDHAVDADVGIDEGDIKAYQLGSGQRHSTGPRKDGTQVSGHLSTPVTTRSVAKPFSTQITGELSNTFRATFVRPAAQGIASWGIDKMTEKISQESDRAIAMAFAQEEEERKQEEQRKKQEEERKKQEAERKKQEEAKKKAALDKEKEENKKEEDKTLDKEADKKKAKAKQKPKGKKKQKADKAPSKKAPSASEQEKQKQAEKDRKTQAEQEAAHQEAQRLIAEVQKEDSGQPASQDSGQRLQALAEQAANIALGLVPGGELGKLLLERVKDPDRLAKMTNSEIINLAASLAMDFTPVGKVLKVTGKAAGPVLKKLQKKVASFLANAFKKGPKKASGWSLFGFFRLFRKKATEEGAR
ncbi:MAG: hypothetical protein AAFQ78_01660, partial [Bacteroidota bacterium]